MIVSGGAVLEDVDVPAAGLVPVRYTRCDDGWSAEFVVSTDAVDDLQVVHRLTAPSLAEARRLVAPAVAFLQGQPIDPLG
jgi:hypothetical protein